MKVVVVRSNENFLMILEYLHYHMDNSYSRELIKVENTFLHFMINEPKFEWNEITFTLLKVEEYKKHYEFFYKYSELIIEHQSLTIIEYFIAEAIKYITKSMYRDTKELYIYKSHYRNWEMEIELNKKDISNIYIPHDIKNKIISDISSFYEERVIKRYSELCINHIRMYMFYGPPGTGKTSLIKALATYFNKNIAYLLISNETDDATLKKCITNLPDNTFLCLEDIDSLFGEDRRSRNSLTFSGFINIFDGFSTPQNLTVFMTTNNLNSLDHAVIRRISYFIEFTYATKAEIKQMFEKFFPENEKFEDFYKNIENTKTTINVLEKFFTKYLFDDILIESKNFSKFANGELKIKINASIYT